MKYNRDKKEIILNRRLSNLDKFVINFVDLLGEYIVVSGYVSILFGRSRATEDVDLLIPKLNYNEFGFLWNKFHKNHFECINTSKPKKAFEMLKAHAVRFSVKDKPIPNIEFKIIKNDIDKYSFDNKIKVILGKKILYISSLEMQIAYKLSLGSDKDIEDAKHLYELFKDKLNKQELLSLTSRLNVQDKLKLIE